MRFVDVPDPARVGGEPDGVYTVFEGTPIREGRFEVSGIELRLYGGGGGGGGGAEGGGGGAGPGARPLVTSVVYTDRGSIEMVYAEGPADRDSLEREGRFLARDLGISGVVLRSVIALEGMLGDA